MTLIEVPEDAEALAAENAADDERALELAGRMCKKLEERAPEIEDLRARFDGDHPMAFATKKWRETFGREFGMVVDNFCRGVVTASTDRMTIHGFRFGQETPDAIRAARAATNRALQDAAAGAAQPEDADDLEADEGDGDAWTIFRRNRLVLDSDLVHTEMLSTGWSYVLVWPDDDDRSVATISVEDPLTTIVLHDPANRRRRIAGLKCWRELNGAWRAMLFTPDRVWSLGSRRQSALPRQWSVIEAGDNPLGIVPLVEFVYDPDIYGRGSSVFAEGVPINDAINKLMADMLVASEFTSFRQRILIGVEVPESKDGGAPPILSGANRWIGLEAATDEDGKQVTPTIQELDTSDLKSYVNGIELLTQHFAALTRTPPHYLVAQLVNVSADALIASQDGLIARTRHAMKLAGESWEEVMRIAFLVEGDTDRGTDFTAETMWADPETTSEAQRADFLTKLKAIGVPQRALWELDGRSPATIRRWMRWAEEEARLDAIRMGIGAGGLAITAADAAAGDAGS